MPLTDTAVRQAKPRSANYKLADAKGLYLLIQSKRREILALQVSLRWQREVKGWLRLLRQISSWDKWIWLGGW
jgi:hypothetical protein